MRARIPSAAVCFFAGAACTLLVVTSFSTPLRVARGDEDRCTAPPCENGDLNGDGSVDISDAVYLLLHLYTGGPAPATISPVRTVCALPATGQDSCYDLARPAVACEATAFPGQDGFYRIGCPAAERFVENGDGTVTDRCTGLLWQKETAPEEYDWAGALEYCESLELAVHSDWRLPNVRELQSIADYGRDHPAIDPVFEAAMGWYWTSSSVAVTPSDAWMVSFGFGAAVIDSAKSGTCQIPLHHERSISAARESHGTDVRRRRHG